MKNKIEELQNDVELRPYFFDFVCKGFVLGLSDTFAVPHVQRVRFQKDYYEALHFLSSQIEKKVSPNEVLDVIHKVSVHYLAHIGRIGFEQYIPANK